MKTSFFQAYAIPILILIVVATGGFFYYNSQVNKESPPVGTGTPTVTQMITAVPTTVIPTPTASDESLLSAAVQAKSGIPKSKFEFSISTNVNDMARGSVRNTDDQEGAMWAAGKVNGVWKVSYVGQGVPLCSDLTGINYPTSWFSHCVDAQGATVGR